MAGGVGMMVGGALVNAFAFSGSNYLFSMLRDSDVAEEQQRHNRAIEQLQAARDAWSQRRTARIDWINEELRRQHHAVQTFRDVDSAMREYARVTGKNIGPWTASRSYRTFTSRARDRRTASWPSLSLGWPWPA